MNETEKEREAKETGKEKQRIHFCLQTLEHKSRSFVLSQVELGHKIWNDFFFFVFKLHTQNLYYEISL